MDKQTIRERVWDAMAAAGVAQFPFPPHGRIPNFEGADDAAARLADQPEWTAASTVKSNPDSPQLPVRRRALRTDKLLYMAVPRLREERCFMTLDPARIDDEAIDDAATISRADQFAHRVAPAEMPSIDLIVAGSVAVTEDGDRIGKGEGYSDLEYGVLGEAGLVDRETTVVTTVHEMQLLKREIDTAPYDVPMDLIVTPDRVIETDRRDDRPHGIDWSALDEETIEAIPILQRLRPE